MNNKFLKWLCGIIPRFIGNGAVIFVFELMRRWHCVFGRKKYSHEGDVVPALKQGMLIENQAMYGKVTLGKVTMKYAGCEVIAAYNARMLLSKNDGKYDFNLIDVVKAFECDGIVFSAKFGVAPAAVRDYMKRCGYEAAMTTNKRKFAALSDASRVLILTAYNDRMDIRNQIHTICISKTVEGLVPHNASLFEKNKEAFATIDELVAALSSGRAKGISLIGIR